MVAVEPTVLVLIASDNASAQTAIAIERRRDIGHIALRIPASVAGADIAGMLPMKKSEADAFCQSGQAVFNRLENLPKPVIAAANAAINAALKEKSVTDSLAIVGLIPHGSTPEEQARWQKAEYDTWGPLIKRIGFSAES